MKRPVIFILSILHLGVIGCNKNSDNSSDPELTGAANFAYSPLNIADIIFATPLGNLNPPGHTFPTDHVYFYWVDPDHRQPGDLANVKTVFAPAGGKVQWILQPNGVGGDSKIGIQVSTTFTYYLDHVILNQGIAAGQSVQAGQILGTSSSQSFAVDLGVVNYNVTLPGFVNPARYPEQTLHTDSPYKYYADSLLKQTLYAKINGSNKDGKIDYDIPGRLVGNWFLQGLPTGSASADPSSWSKHLAFVYDMYAPTAVRISIGGTLAMTGVFSISQTAPDPANVSTSTGKVNYKLYQGGTFLAGLMIVQMIAGDQVKVEAFAGSTADSASFDSNAFTYTR